MTSLAGAWLLALNGTASGAMPPPSVLRQARTAWYVLGPDCGLSAGVATRLAQHAPRSDLREQVWLTADDPATAAILGAAGFAVGRAEAPRLPGRRPGPWLALLDDSDHVIFTGPFPPAWDAAEPTSAPPHFLAALAPGQN